MLKPTLKDFLILHFIVLIWGFTAILGDKRLVSLNPLVLVFYRTLFTAVALAVWFFYAKKSFRLPKEALLKMMGTGGIIAVHWLLFFGASRVSNISICLVGLATSTLWTSLLEPILYRRKFRKFQIVLGIVTFTGILQVFGAEFNYASGFILGILSAFAGALFSVINSKFIRKYDQFTITFYEMLGAFLCVTLFLCMYESFTIENSTLLPEGMEWFWISILSLVCTVYAYPMGIKLMKKFSVFAVNLTVNLEPVYGILLAFVVFGEREKMSPNFYIGASIILLAVFSYPIMTQLASERKKRKVMRRKMSREALHPLPISEAAMENSPKTV